MQTAYIGNIDNTKNQLALKRKLSDFLDEYDEKTAAVKSVVSAFAEAGSTLKTACCIGGTWGQTTIETGRVDERDVLSSLLKSAWLHVYNYLPIECIASAEDKKRLAQMMTSPPPFTIENIRDKFGKYIIDPRGNILRGLAEVFASLDPAYKSHDKVKIGVSGLPKRVILSGFGEYSYGSWGREKLTDVINALAVYQAKPLVEYQEIDALRKDENALLSSRGIRLRTFSNGNGHLFFEPDTLRDINRALAEYYGEVLADCSDDDEPEKRQSTAISKDLQYYPTPKAVVERVIGNLHIQKGERVLEPSCGCGRFLDALRAAGADVWGVEVDPVRAGMCRDKGHNVLTANFLETVPTGDMDQVVMNPPFFGRHYAKHIKHALMFLKPGGKLTAILPITARYDHGALDDLIKSQGRYSSPWSDLPVGSFSESGTNINTTVLTLYAPKG
ncbi:DUF4942 domain-containing protein [Rhodopila sp.]|uniref:DUF4942 domain-containing protein n=1 Tax=Rhodopila sp. TaxID=2480087 RepID=UPI003D14EB89